MQVRMLGAQCGSLRGLSRDCHPSKGERPLPLAGPCFPRGPWALQSDDEYPVSLLNLATN